MSGNNSRKTEIVCISPTTNTLFSTEVDLGQGQYRGETSENNSLIRNETKELFDSYSKEKTDVCSDSQVQQFDIDKYEKDLELASRERRDKFTSKRGKQRWSVSRSRSGSRQISRSRNSRTDRGSRPIDNATTSKVNQK